MSLDGRSQSSPDRNTRGYFDQNGDRVWLDVFGPVDTSLAYERPIGASPIRIPLVPAFSPCDPGASNASHPAPLAGRSCSPPAPASSLAAVGPKSLSFVRMRVLGQGECAPSPPTACYPDVVISSSLTDIRSGSPSGGDYETFDDLGHDMTLVETIPDQARGTGLQITDRNNTTDQGQSNQAATVIPLPYPVPLACTPTADPSTGSRCGVQTTSNSIAPGSAVQGQRSIWELGQFEVLDQGPDGTPANSDDNLFAVQGVFVP